jgi:hypothetical protein
VYALASRLATVIRLGRTVEVEKKRGMYTSMGRRGSARSARV